ncbi:UNVERIFIED_CONTAM: putative mitochondrial protein [Sesamum latifolium]|uniref:Mitochondrial protein n=1 Tax=Sesamum latifolium TaxID=2727402 RepID=A0AAW2TPT0_9LAMI
MESLGKSIGLLEEVCRSKGGRGLGFKHLKAFNQAMLAKQLWRVLTRPECLLSQVLKQRYFPNSDLLQQKSVHMHPTLVSMFETRGLIIAGSRWSVGDGLTVRVLEDWWLLRPRSFRIMTSFIGWRRNATVRSIMTEDGVVWDANLVRALFPQEEADCILAVPIRGQGTADR